MGSFKDFGIAAAVVVTLVAGAGLLPGAARAADTVDVTYDLSDTELMFIWGLTLSKVGWVRNDDPVNGTVAGSMKVRYQSNSNTSMPIVHGDVSLVSFDLSVRDFTMQVQYNSGTGPRRTVNADYVAGSFHWQLAGSPLQGTLRSGGTLTGLAGGLKLTGTARCLTTNPQFCTQGFALPPYGITRSFTRYYSGPFTLAGSVGPAGGAASTRHTLTGSGPIKARFGLFLGLADSVTHNGYGGVNLVGREILREAEGHDPKVIPEPGTLLLLGAGTAGLALVGRATRGSRRS